MKKQPQRKYIYIGVFIAGGLIFLFFNGLFNDWNLQKPNSIDLSRSPDINALHQECEGKISCFQMALEEIVKDHGTGEALLVIEQLAPKDRTLLNEAHNLTHYVGRFSYQHYKDVSQVIFECKESFQSGCYHGVLEAYFSDKTRVQAADVANICESDLEARKGRFAYFNCLHGLGHGLTMVVQHDMKEALSFCDALSSGWDRESCYGGVFMENVVTATKPEHLHADHAKKLIDSQDLLYPCSDLNKKYWRACYLMQTSIILNLTEYDFAKAFKVCETAPEEMIPTCFQSMGRDISGFTLRDSMKSIHLCGLGSPIYRERCLVGVVKNFLNVTGRASEDAFTFCQQVDGSHKKSCYFAVGEELVNLYSDLEARTKACARSEEDYIQDCNTGAQIPTRLL
jgi:hypothetical protein